MVHNSYLLCLNAAICFPSFFYGSLVSPKKHICAHVLAHPYPSDPYKAIFVSHTITHASPLLAPTLSAHLLSSSARPLFTSVSLSHVSKSL
ncbi:unnamed protein product [Hymenolepis diminuta]|uniref:Uncharacterized protein n=1 Tax=Hymenolepis diminuta TaxID=6216 RepID=A0A564YVE4_HYMDI|nr:unnamed protein product [Hymenolepis diminuta]